MVPRFDPLDVPPTWDILVGLGYGLGACYDNERRLPGPDPQGDHRAIPAGEREVFAEDPEGECPKGECVAEGSGKLDLEIRNLAPLAVMHTYNNRFFFGERRPASLMYHAVYPDWSILALALKSMRRLWLSTVMLVAGGRSWRRPNSPVRRLTGGWRVEGRHDRRLVQVDPQLAFITTAWWLEYATAAKLYRYPDKNGPSGTILQPEVASSTSSRTAASRTRSSSARGRSAMGPR